MITVTNLSPANMQYIKNAKNNPKPIESTLADFSAPEKFEKSSAKISKKKKIALFALVAASFALIAGIIFKGKGGKILNNPINPPDDKTSQKAKESLDSALGKLSNEQREIFENAVHADQKAADALISQKDKIQNASPAVKNANETIEASKPKAQNVVSQAEDKISLAVPSSLIKSQDELEKMSIIELGHYEVKIKQELNRITPDESSEAYGKLEKALDDIELCRNKIYTDVEDNIFANLKKELGFKVNDKDESFQFVLKRLPVKKGEYIIKSTNAPNVFLNAEIALPEAVDSKISENLAQGYKNSSLQLKRIYNNSDIKYRKLDKTLVKQAVHDSKQLGYEGRVWVEVEDMPSVLKRISLASGTDFNRMWNLGFRFDDEKLNELAQNNPNFFKDENVKLGKRLMYLSQEAIEGYLKKNK